MSKSVLGLSGVMVQFPARYWSTTPRLGRNGAQHEEAYTPQCNARVPGYLPPLLYTQLFVNWSLGSGVVLCVCFYIL